MMKNKLAYSELTDSIYWIDGRGGKHEITQNFIQVMLLWIHEGTDIAKVGSGFSRKLTGQMGKNNWDISVKRIK